MKERTLRLILDSIFFGDAMSPEFKKANDILLRIIKTNDRAGGIEYTRLAEINKAFKANDAKAARVAFDKLKPLLAKGDKELQDGLTEARTKLAEASQKAEQSNAALTSAKGAVALFDRFRKAIDGVKARPAAVSKLSAYADKLKAYGDFSKRIAQMSQMVAAKKDVSKQADLLAAACDKGKAKADKERAKAEKDYKAAQDRVSVFKEMEKIRSKKIAEFAKEREDVQKLGQALPNYERETSTPKKLTPDKLRAIEYIDTVFARQLQKEREKLFDCFEELKKKQAQVKSLEENVKENAKQLTNALDKVNERYGVNAPIRKLGNNLKDNIYKELMFPDRKGVDRLEFEIKNYISVLIEDLSRVGWPQDLANMVESKSNSLIETMTSLCETVEGWGRVREIATLRASEPLSILGTEPGKRLNGMFEKTIENSFKELRSIMPNIKLPSIVLAANDVDAPEALIKELKQKVKRAKEI